MLKRRSASKKKPKASGESDNSGKVDQVKHWYSDRYQTVIIQRNILTIVAFMSLAALLITLYALKMLNDSKTFEPYLVQIEDKTGIVTQLDKRSVQKFSADETVTRFFLTKYIQARESYNVVDYVHFYSQVARLLSKQDVYSTFRQQISFKSPDSPLNLGRTSSIHVDLKSIVFLEKGKVQVRFKKTKTRGALPRSGNVESVEHLISTINFGYFNVNLSLKDRETNPLGFQVTSYRVDRDTVK